MGQKRVFPGTQPTTKGQIGDSIYKMSKAATVTDTEKRILVAIGWGEERGDVLFNGRRVSVLQSQRRPGAWWHSRVNMLNVTKLHTQKWPHGTLEVVHFPTVFVQKKPHTYTSKHEPAAGTGWERSGKSGVFGGEGPQTDAVGRKESRK